MALLVDCSCTGVAYRTLGSNWIYSLSDIDYISNLTFHHELGHNSNLNHNYENSSS